MSVVMVTGATTPLGEALLAALLADEAVAGVLAVALDAPEPAPAHPRLRWRRVDLSRSRDAHDLLFGEARAMGVDVVVHAAMHRSPRATGRRVHAHNVEALRGLLKLCARHPGVRRFVLRSDVAVYRVDFHLPALLTEEHPVDLSPEAPQWVRDRVEADLTACVRVGGEGLEVCVLRCAEILAPGTGSQLHDALRSRVVLRPMGYDPMHNLLSLPDAAEALRLAALHPGATGVFNIPGADTLPLSELIRRAGRPGVPLPGPLVHALTRARARARRLDFSYALMRQRLHYNAVLDGTRAAGVLGYRPAHPLDWPGGLGIR